MFICDKNDVRYACQEPEKIIVDYIDGTYLWGLKIQFYDALDFEKVQRMFNSFWYFYNENTEKVTDLSNFKILTKYEIHYREDLTNYVVVQLAKELLI